jgi:hypothetical protein
VRIRFRKSGAIGTERPDAARAATRIVANSTGSNRRLTPRSSHNLDNHPGHFNTARVAPKAAESVATKTPAKTPDAGDRHAMMTHRTLTGSATNPFRNDTGA